MNSDIMEYYAELLVKPKFWAGIIMSIVALLLAVICARVLSSDSTDESDSIIIKSENSIDNNYSQQK